MFVLWGILVWFDQLHNSMKLRHALQTATHSHVAHMILQHFPGNMKYVNIAAMHYVLCDMLVLALYP